MVVTRRSADELTGIFGEVFDDRLGVFFLECFTGDNHRAGVDILRRQAGVLVRRVDEVVDLIRVDLGRRNVRRQHDRRAIKDFAGSDSKLSRERGAFTAQRNQRKNQMRSRRADVDAHALEREHFQPFDIGDDFVFLNDKIIGMVVIVNIIVHEFASVRHFFASFRKRNPHSLERGFHKQLLGNLSPLVVYCLPIALDHS